MLSVVGPAEVGGVQVMSTSNRGFTPEELADQAINKIMYVGDQSHPAIRDQAQAFREQIRAVLIHYMKRAIDSHNTTVAGRLREAGHEEIIPLLK